METNRFSDQAHIRNFYSIYEENGSLTYREGWERIPENWYKTPVDWGVIQLNLDTLDFIAQYPELGRYATYSCVYPIYLLTCYGYSVGGNTGEVNSFAGLDIANLTGGVYSLTNLLEGNNLLCFVFEVLKFAGPNALAGIYKTLSGPLDFITDALAIPLLNLTCPAFQDLQEGGKPLWEAIKGDFPGALKSGSAF